MSKKVKRWADNPTTNVVDMDAARNSRERQKTVALTKSKARELRLIKNEKRREEQAELLAEVVSQLSARKVRHGVGVVSVMKAGYQFCGRDLNPPYHGKGKNNRQLKNILRWLSDNDIKKSMQKHKALADDFLETYEWRRLRMEVLKKNDGRCECCGRSKHNGIYLCVDHIKPRKTHPELALDDGNLQVLCNECNHGKGNWDETDWRQSTG